MIPMKDLKSVDMQVHPMYADPAGGLCGDDSVNEDPPVELCLWARGYATDDFGASGDEPEELLDVGFPCNPENKKALLDLGGQLRGLFEGLLGPEAVQYEVLDGRGA